MPTPPLPAPSALRPGRVVSARAAALIASSSAASTSPMSSLSHPQRTPMRAPSTFVRPRLLHATACPQCRRRPSPLPLLSEPSSSRRTFVSSPSSSSDGGPSLAAYAPQSALVPATLTDTQYHALADAYLDRLLVGFEDMQDAREDVDVEYASGVLTLVFTPSTDTGGRTHTYVINKQPPNKQIWLSSPVSGPKRYDWVLDADADPVTDAAVPSKGRWIYLKDGSAFDDLLRDEVGLQVDAACEEA